MKKTTDDIFERSELAKQFPALRQSVNGHPLIYMDTAATAQRPTTVTDALIRFYQQHNANPGQTLHTLARRAYEVFEEARRKVAEFIGAGDPLEIVWTRGTTEAINLVATAWGSANLRSDDHVVLTVSEHSSCMLPWQLAAQRAGATIQYINVRDDGALDLDELDRALTKGPKILCLPHVSNTLGIINPVGKICARARQHNVKVLVDAAQSVPHFAVNVRDLGCDFLAFSGHKMMGPMGIGVLWARREVLEGMPPYQAGSNMAHGVDLTVRDYSAGSLKFGAGTPNVADAVALAAAIEFIDKIGRRGMWAHEQSITRRTWERLSSMKGVRILGSQPDNRISLFTFVVDGVPTEEIVKRLDHAGIAIRGGDIASLPLLKRFGVTSAARCSLYIYTSTDDVDRFADVLENIAWMKP
jgi:cysteine desulfurase/selenocysteine lyase